MTAPARIFSLNVHAGYACRHSGACCTAGWAIPVEPDRQALLGRPLLLPDADGACEFFDGSSKLCRVHRDRGPDRLPDACFQFPRRALIDDRGIFVSLSHFCPTAAALVVRATEPPTIVESPPAFPAGRRYDGMDGRGAWPPLVKSDILFDAASYSRWEAFVIATLGAPDATAGSALECLAAAAEVLRRWTPADGSLDQAVQALASTGFRPVRQREAAMRYQHLTTADAYEHILQFVPDGLPRPGLVTDVRRTLVTPPWDWGARDGAARRYLAAKAFGSWAAYEAHGVRTMVAELVLAELVLRVEAARLICRHQGPMDDDLMIESIRAADWLLVHLVERSKLVPWLGLVER